MYIIAMVMISKNMKTPKIQFQRIGAEFLGRARDVSQHSRCKCVVWA